MTNIAGTADNHRSPAIRGRASAVGVSPGFGFTNFTKMEADFRQANQWFSSFWAGHGVPVDGGFDIESRTGIQERPFFHSSRSVVAIAQTMLQTLRNTAEQNHNCHCDGFLLVSSRPDIAAVAAQLSRNLDMPGEALNWACSGFGAAAAKLVADAHRRFGSAANSRWTGRQILVVWLEVWRDLLNLCNFRVAPLFGDCCVGAGFTSIGTKSDNGKPVVRFEIRDAFARRIGVEKPLIWLNRCDGGVEHYRDIHSQIYRQRPAFDAAGAPYSGLALDMNGKAVFREAPRRMIDLAEEGLTRCGLSLADVHSLLPHSANARMRVSMAQIINKRGFTRWGNDGERCWEEADVEMDMEKQGNPGCGAIPLKLCHRQQTYAPGTLIVTPAVGAGRSVGNWDVPLGSDEVERTTGDKGELTGANVVLAVHE